MTDTRTTRDNPVHHGDGEADYYAILGVAPDASRETIHQAYRRLAKLWHPDRYSFAPPELRARAERRMRAISRAWAEVGDPIRRRAYDQRRYGFSWDSFVWRPAAQSHPEKYHGNGAGMFVGMLCVILALPLLINLLNGALHETWQVVLVTVTLIVLAALAGLFFTSDSPLAHLATTWAEGEPRGFYEQPVASQQQTGSGYAFHVTSDDDDDDDDGDGDDAAEQARQFDRLVKQALATIPESFKSYMRNVLVQVEREPSDETLQRMDVRSGHTLLGLYTGVPLTAQGAREAGPEIVTIFRGPIERYCQGDPDRIREQVRRTVLHEVAHHFGIDHDEMPDWVK